MMEIEDKVGFCTLCKSRCGAIYSVSEDRLIDVRANPSHPTGAAICPKGRAAPEIVYSPQRLTRPLRRTNPKTASDPGWQAISWDDALAEVATGLDTIRRESGPEAVAFALTSPSGSALSDSMEWIERFIRLFGSPNECSSIEICNWQKDIAHAYTFGTPLGMPDYANTDLAMLWGQNPARTWLAQSTALAEAKERGAKIAVVDPRESGTARHADHWLRVRPGSDGALALGLGHLLIQTGRYDTDFIRRWSNGPCLVRSDDERLLRGGDIDPELDPDTFVVWDADAGGPVPYDTRRTIDEALSRRLALEGSFRVDTVGGPVACRPAFDWYAKECARWTPQQTAATTWVPEGQIRELADAMADAARVAYYAWAGLSQHTNATQTGRALGLLSALKGSHDAVGGNLVLPRQPANAATSLAQLPAEQRGKTLGLDQMPIGPPSQGWITSRSLYTAILEHEPYAVRGLMGFGANLLMSHADPQRGRKALQALDFFVHCDLFMNPTAELADIVLPVNSAFEREGLRLGFEVDHAAQELVQLRQRIVTPVGEARSDMQIVFDLATRLGLGDEFFGGSIEAGWDHVLEPLELTVAELRERPEGVRRPLPVVREAYSRPSADGVVGFATESRRVEIYSELFGRHGYDPVPRFVEPSDGPEGEGSDFPYVLTCANNGNFVHSQHRGVSSLRSRTPEPSVDLHPELAAAHDIEAGDWVALRTRHGAVRLRARLDDSLHPRVVMSEYGWWQPAQDLALPGYDPFDDGGANYNRMIAYDHADPVSGAPALRSFACSIERDAAADGTGRWRGERAFTVSDVEPESDNVVSISLEPLDRGPLPAFRPGQHVVVRAETVGSQGSVSRSYSLSSSAFEAMHERYRVTVKLLDRSPQGPPGVMSEYLTQQLRVGDLVKLTAPGGAFAIPAEHDHPVVLIASGIGITPFMSYLQTLADGGAAPEVTLYYSSRNGQNHVFRDAIREIAEKHDIRVVNHYTQPGADDIPGRDFDVEGRISADDIDQELIDRRARFYVCATDAMMSDIRAGLVRRGVPAFDIFQERFVAPEPTLEIPDDATYSVRLERSQHELTWRKASGSLLSAAEAAGAAMPSGCRVGQCENCRVRIVSGRVQYLTEVFEADDPSTCLTCQAVPVTDVVLDA